MNVTAVANDTLVPFLIQPDGYYTFEQCWSSVLLAQDARTYAIEDWVINALGWLE